MNYILLALIVFSFLVCLENIIKKKRNLFILIFFGSLFFLSIIIISGVSFSPKSSFKISNLFMADYIEEYKIDGNNTIVIGKNNDSYFIYKSRKVAGFIYVKQFSNIDELYLYPITYGINEDDNYFYDIEFIQTKEFYFFLVKKNVNVNDQVYFDNEKINFLNQENTDEFIFFISSNLPKEVNYNNTKMNIIYKSQLNI